MKFLGRIEDLAPEMFPPGGREVTDAELLYELRDVLEHGSPQEQLVRARLFAIALGRWEGCIERLAAERERCARVVEQEIDDGYPYDLLDVAAKIREGT